MDNTRRQLLFDNVDWTPVVSAIQASSSVHLVTHCMPDADGIGSQIALYVALKRLGKRVVMHNRDAIPYICGYLEHAQEIKSGVVDLPQDADMVIALDAGSQARLGMDSSHFEGKLFLNIDHHISNEMYGDIQLIDDRYCSTGAMIFDLLIKLDIPLDAAIASAIYATVITDTSSFRQSTVNGDVHRMVANLIDAGANPYESARALYFSHRHERFLLLPLALSTLTIDDEGRSAWMYVDASMYETSGGSAKDTEGFIDYARSIGGVCVAVFIRREEDSWKVSMRGDGVNVGLISEQFGGGGHRYAAGFSTDMGLDVLMASLKQSVTRILNSSH